MTSRLYELIKNFDSIVGDNPLQDPNLTLNIFSQLLPEVRIRKQRQTIQLHQDTLACQQPRPLTPPPKYTHVKSKKVPQPPTN
jgi:hypothetical protein